MWLQMFQNMAVVSIRSKLFTDPLLIAPSGLPNTLNEPNRSIEEELKMSPRQSILTVGSEKYQPEVLLPLSFLA